MIGEAVQVVGWTTYYQCNLYTFTQHFGGKWKKRKPVKTEMDAGARSRNGHMSYPCSFGIPALSHMKTDCDDAWTV